MEPTLSDRDGTPPCERVLVSIAASRPVSWFYVNVAPMLDRALLRLTGGRLTTVGRHRVGYLRVIGAKSGIRRVTPLVYTLDGDRVILVASRGGDSRHPAWYRNLVANPRVTFSIDGKERAYRARELGGQERQEAWRRAVRRYPGYAIYQRRAGRRTIPLFLLDPA